MGLVAAALTRPATSRTLVARPSSYAIARSFPWDDPPGLQSKLRERDQSCANVPVTTSPAGS